VRLPAPAYGSDGAVLLLDDNNRLESLPVELVRRQGDDVLVRGAGLAGRLVVAERTPLLGAGIGVKPLGDEVEAEDQATPPAGRGGGFGGGDGEMIAIDDEKRAELIKAVESNGMMPANAKERILEMLKQPEVPKSLVDRLERGGRG